MVNYLDIVLIFFQLNPFESYFVTFNTLYMYIQLKHTLLYWVNIERNDVLFFTCVAAFLPFAMIVPGWEKRGGV